MRKLTAVAAGKDAGRKVKYFVRGDMGVSYGQFSALKMSGGLLVNGAPVHANHPLSPGDTVTVLLADAPAGKAVAPQEGPVNVVYGDEDLILIDKPAPLATQCSPKQPGGTLENRLAWLYRDRPGFVFRPLNRLDRGTSGLMAAAMNAHAAQRLQRQLHTDQFVREYLAVVEGRMEGEGAVDAPIRKQDAATVRRIVDIDSGARAVTHYRVERPGGRYSLVRLRLETGRTHQIRVHMAHLGHPVAGDFLYGTEDPRLPGRFALHSTYIRLTHPVTGEVIEAESPLPEALAKLLEENAMEHWDAYDKDLNRLEGLTLVRGEPIPDGVCHLVCDILVRHTDGDYLLMRRDPRKAHGGMWEASAGGAAQQGEGALEAALRELKEETGIAADALTEVGRDISPERHAIYVAFLCVTDRDKADIALQEGETVDFRWVSREALLSMDGSELLPSRMKGFIMEKNL